MLSPSPLVLRMVAARKGGGRTEGGRLAGEDSGPGGRLGLRLRSRATGGYAGTDDKPEFSAPSAEADRKYGSGKIRRDRRRSVLSFQRLSGQSDNRKIAPAEAIAGRGDSCFRGPVGQFLILRNGMDRGLTAGLLLFPFAERFVHFLLFLLVVLFRVSLHFVDEMVDLIAEILLAWGACVVLFHNCLLLMFTEHDSKMRTIPFLERNLFRSRLVRVRTSIAART